LQGIAETLLGVHDDGFPGGLFTVPSKARVLGQNFIVNFFCLLQAANLMVRQGILGFFLYQNISIIIATRSPQMRNFRSFGNTIAGFAIKPITDEKIKGWIC